MIGCQKKTAADTTDNTAGYTRNGHDFGLFFCHFVCGCRNGKRTAVGAFGKNGRNVLHSPVAENTADIAVCGIGGNITAVFAVGNGNRKIFAHVKGNRHIHKADDTACI